MLVETIAQAKKRITTAFSVNKGILLLPFGKNIDLMSPHIP